MKKIPLHSLVVLVGPKNSGKQEIVEKKLPNDEVISPDMIMKEIFGEYNSFIDKNAIFQEFLHRVELKLRFGQRAIALHTNLAKDERIKLNNVAKRYNVPVYYIICYKSIDKRWKEVKVSHKKEEEFWNKNKKDIFIGDHIAEVIDAGKDEFKVVDKLPKSDILKSLSERGFTGLTVMADVHGMKEALHDAVHWAKLRGRFLISLGDMIDYGPDPIGVVNLVYDEIIRGRMVVIPGNHENKINRWLSNIDSHNHIHLSEGNRVTVNAFKELGKSEQTVFLSSWQTILSNSNYIWQVGENIFMTHGAIKPSFWRNEKFEKDQISYCLFGQVDDKRTNGYHKRVYDWCDEIPNGKIVLVGHDIRSMDAPTVYENENGGTAIFLDCGAGKGGTLHTCDIQFPKEGQLLKRGVFNRH